jgi:hypothetical protein
MSESIEDLVIQYADKRIIKTREFIIELLVDYTRFSTTCEEAQGLFDHLVDIDVEDIRTSAKTMYRQLLKDNIK